MRDALLKHGTRHNLGFLLAKASQRWNELLYAAFCRAGYAEVRPAYGSILLPLFEQDGLSMGELARRARLSKQTMTTLVRAMEANGLVRRVQDPADRRAYRIYLTDRAHAFRTVAEQVLGELETLVAAALTPEQVAGLKDTLMTLMDLDIDQQGGDQ
jgi:DNA-binding MarR family transcriptional regulator